MDVITRESGGQILDLEKFGVQFRKRQGSFHMALMAGHTNPRNAFGDRAVGTDLTLPLRDYAANQGVTFKEGVLITGLLKTGDGVFGAVGIDNHGGVFVFIAKSVVLAVGGAGEIYLKTSNAPGSTGDGFAMSYGVGVPLVDMEFIQFGVTGPHVEMFCAREGAVIRNAEGENILKKYDMDDPVKMTRDAVSRAIMMEILEGAAAEDETLTLDITPVPEARIEAIRVLLPKNAPKEQRHFTVGLQSHYFMGGADINTATATCIDGLFCAGEICAGVNGANRLGGNALAEAFVFGKIAGQTAGHRALSGQTVQANDDQISTEIKKLKRLAASAGHENIKELRRLLRTCMWKKAGVIRNEAGLKEALVEITSLKERFQSIFIEDPRDLTAAVRLNNMLTVSEMVVKSALLRTESRGAHYRTDHPEEHNPEWLKHIVIAQKDGEMMVTTVPVDLSRLKPEG
ncbi:FAD-binding protein [Thermodesulfobacteriota bacterium]